MPNDAAETNQTEKYYTLDDTEIRFSNSVPELLRGVFTGKMVLSEAQLARAEELDTMVPLDRAECGAEEWNMWVQAYAERWCVREERNDHIYVRMKIWNDEGHLENRIDFSTGQETDENDVYEIHHNDFSGFHFPAPANFQGATFLKGTSFNGAIFSGYAEFSEVTFSRPVGFSKTAFAEYVNFIETTFSRNVVFNKTAFAEHVNFIETTFSGYTHFNRATFSEGADFDGATFQKDLLSQRAIFFSKARWDNTVFHQSVNFSSSQFLDGCTFENAKFHAFTDFDHVWFGKTDATPKPKNYANWDKHLKNQYDAITITPKSETVPNFLGAVFEQAPNLGYTDIPEVPLHHFAKAWQANTDNGKNLWQKLTHKTGKFFSAFGKSARTVIRPKYWRIHFKIWKKAIWHDRGHVLKSQTYDSQAAAKLRRLQELAAQGHHHLAEKRFFRVELLARRGNEAKSFWERSMIRAFEMVSKCGLSFIRPLLWLGLFWFPVFILVYGSAADLHLLGDGWHLISRIISQGFTTETSASFAHYKTDISNLAQYSLVNSLSFLGGLSGEHAAVVDYLFPIKSSIPHWTKFLHNSIATLHIFFALLAVRNYFKLG